MVRMWLGNHAQVCWHGASENVQCVAGVVLASLRVETQMYAGHAKHLQCQTAMQCPIIGSKVMQLMVMRCHQLCQGMYLQVTLLIMHTPWLG
jgi:predicted molibdopterin-dependent oxidoreductase YjgC